MGDRLYRLKAEVLDPSSSSSPPRPWIEIEFLNPIEVKQMGSVVGWASLYWQGPRLLADVVLLYASPARLNLENGDKYYLRPQGVIELGSAPFESSDPLESSAPVSDINKITILSLDVGLGPAFPGQTPFGETVL
jgi:hypothetical protein